MKRMYAPFNKKRVEERDRRIRDYVLGIAGAAIFSALVYSGGIEGCYKTKDIMHLDDRVYETMEKKGISYEEAVKDLEKGVNK